MKGIVIAGPTGVGKTELSIKLAKEIDAYIISADSAQVYKEMDIGTAKILENEMCGVKHYMIDVVEPVKKYNVGEYERQVTEILEKNKGKNVILVGGTGLYIDSIVRGLSTLPDGNEKIRKQLEKKSVEELYDELKKIDPESAENIHTNNRRKVERALEVFLLTGEKFSVLSKKNIKRNDVKFLKFALERDREELYNRINLRVDIMLENGLLEEVKKLYKKFGDNLKKINIIGYSEIISFLDGEITFEEAKELIKQHSRNYAKRQFTWFKNDSEYEWFSLDKVQVDEVVKQILKK